MSEIFIERDAKNRSQYYLAAKTRIHNEIYKQVIAYGLMTPQFRQVLATDYSMMSNWNKQLEVAENGVFEKSDHSKIFRKKFE